jgi:DNA-binding MarR family transcriptional regulator
MGELLRQRLHQEDFENATHEALLNVLVASAHVRRRLDGAFEPHDLTHGQYNVLRILRGARPEGFPRCEIAHRMIESAPDLTRLIDRLEKRGLVERARSAKDARLSVTRITRRGLELLDRVQPALNAIHTELAKQLPARDAKELSRLCEKLYGEKLYGEK